MSLKAHTNERGLLYNHKKFLSEWKGDNGEYFSEEQWISLGHSYKPLDIQRPEWIDAAGSVCFKKPSLHVRNVSVRTNPAFTEQYYWDPAHTSHRAVINSYMSWRIGNHPDLFKMPNCMQDLGSNDPFQDTNTYNRLLISCYLQINEQKLALGTALAEGVTTVNMIAKSTSDLVKLLLAAKRGNWGAIANTLGLRGRKALELPSNYYLQWKYGWKPLMSDIRDGVELLKTQIPPVPLLHVIKSHTEHPEWEFDVGGVNGYSTVKGKGMNRTAVELWCTMDSSSWNHTAHSLGLDNPLSILWEVTPYSFVVDWVVPIGDYLTALSAMAGLSLVGGYTSYKGQGSSMVSFHSTDPAAKGSYPDTQIDRFGFQRFPMDGLPVPLPYYKSPFTTQNTLSALALLNQLVKKVF